MSAASIYAERNPEDQGAHYMLHIDRMTTEGLHSKSAIAGELAHRDIEIDRLKAANAELAEALEALTSAVDVVAYGAAIESARTALNNYQGATK